MAEFLTTSGTSHYIENIIIDAKTKLILVSPYLQISKTLQERLKDASNRNVRIKIIYGKDELKPNEKNSLSELKNLELYFSGNLHAKCYFNETKMVITSMNMYEFSEKNNREMGVLIDLNVDKELFEKAENETLSIIQSAKKIRINNYDRNYRNENYNNNTKSNYKNRINGHCLRCNDRINYNPYSPFCGECYSTWSVYQNYDYGENVCHRCGENEIVSMRRPQCNKCFNLWTNEN
ncbi:phospholipase D family protein [Flavobacterium sp.]|uniref:phospholipase D family protein n=1 Tax=Flavobacterium sp. TaxID=239 RepID=UPI003919DC52